MQEIDSAYETLLARAKEMETPRDIFKASEFRDLYGMIPTLAPDARREYGQKINNLKQDLEKAVAELEHAQAITKVQALDVTAPWDSNAEGSMRPGLLPTENGTRHPLTLELEKAVDIFTRMGFEAVESRQIDTDWHMFGALNFPEGHPARDGYDSFRTEEGFIPPAHTSTMQHRILKTGKAKLERGEAIASISYGRVFRNEDIDATHEHTFHQIEGVYVSSTATLGDMLGVLRSFFEIYYGQRLAIKTQPGYFPFVEPGLEFCIEKPASIGGKPGEWLEMLGCGMIHPNVLKYANIDPEKYRGFAWGGGVERLIMLAYGIEDMRHFHAGKLEFLRKFV
ncbi:Phenylalanine--tRNA ligase [candidate division TM7 genomosp. GTL1]|nr:Phenylalanine--tRNA ligase [candidate division TM7 genomosp. GTL1]